MVYSISLPALVSAGPPAIKGEVTTDSGISIHVKALGIELDFPALTSVDKQLYVHDAVLGCVPLTTSFDLDLKSYKQLTS